MSIETILITRTDGISFCRSEDLQRLHNVLLSERFLRLMSKQIERFCRGVYTISCTVFCRFCNTNFENDFKKKSNVKIFEKSLLTRSFFVIHLG